MGELELKSEREKCELELKAEQEKARLEAEKEAAACKHEIKMAGFGKHPPSDINYIMKLYKQYNYINNYI